LFAWCFVSMQDIYGQAFTISGSQNSPVDCSAMTQGNATASINVGLGSCALNSANPPTFAIFVNGVNTGITTTTGGAFTLPAAVVGNAGVYTVDIVMTNAGGGDCGPVPNYNFGGGPPNGSFDSFMLPISTNAGDNTPPTALCLGTPIVYNLSAPPIIGVTDIDAGSFDNCMSPVRMTVPPVAFNCNDVGCPRTVTLQVSDNGPDGIAGNADDNIAMCTTPVTVVDDVAPTITGCAAMNPIILNIDNVSTSMNFGTVSTDETILAGFFGLGTNDNCNIFINPGPNGTTNAVGFENYSETFTCADVGTTVTRTLRIQDASFDCTTGLPTVQNGLFGTCAIQITIADPTVNAPICGGDFQVEVVGDGSGGFTTNPNPATMIDAGSTVDCNSTISSDLANFNFDCTTVGQTHVVTLTINVGNDNNTANDLACTVNIDVTDANSNVVCVPNNTITFNLNDPLQPPLLIADLINEAASVVSCNTTNQLVLDQSNLTCMNFPGPTTVRLFADANGNGVADPGETPIGCNVQVMLADSGPQAVCQQAGAVSIAIGAQLNAASIDNGSTASCGSAGLNFSVDPTTFTCDDLGLQTVILTVTDMTTGAVDICQTEVTVTGTTATVTATATNPMCAGDATGTATVNAPAGATFQWSNGQTTSTISNLTAGTYTVTVSGGGGACGDVVAVATVTDPPALTVSAAGTNPACNGGTLQVVEQEV